MKTRRSFSSDRGSLRYDDDKEEDFLARTKALYIMMMTRRRIFSSERGSLRYDGVKEEDF